MPLGSKVFGLQGFRVQGPNTHMGVSENRGPLI